MNIEEEDDKQAPDKRFQDDDALENQQPEEAVNEKETEQTADAEVQKDCIDDVVAKKNSWEKQQSEVMKGEETEKTVPSGDGVISDGVIADGVISDEPMRHEHSFWVSRAKAVARRPWSHMIVWLVIASIFSAVGMVVGKFEVEVNNTGWTSRGTLISLRGSQAFLVQINSEELATGDEAVWENLLTKVQPGWESDEGGGRSDQVRRQLMQGNERSTVVPDSAEESSVGRRQMQQYSSLEGCDLSYYYSGRALRSRRLWPIWRVTQPDIASALDPQAIRDICVAEHTTQSVLEEEGLCIQCNTGRCYPPLSLVFYARIQVGDTNFSLPCDELGDTWSVVAETETALLQECVEAIKDSFSFEDASLPYPCPLQFSTSMVDEFFGADKSRVEYSSSIFATRNDPQLLYEHESKYDRASAYSSVVIAAYDTAWEDFHTYYSNDAVPNDMILAMGSALLTGFAMLLHTRSPWITVVGIVQIILSFPLAYFVYTFIARLEFFPFLNFIGLFVVFALGADDVFVATDKWKNARIDNPNGSVEDVAGIALPDAAGAMGLTTLTTAVAFFATAICPVAPLKCFAVFCGLLVVFDYIMCVLLIFPALCIYDNWLVKRDKINLCCSCQRKKPDQEDAMSGDEDKKESLIRRILTRFYTMFHKVRWILFVVCIAATVVSIVFATKLRLPESSAVRLLRDTEEFEQAYDWRQSLLSASLEREAGAPGAIIWGVLPADTGDHTNPQTFTQLVLDDAFDPATTESQEYLLGFCDRLFQQEFATLWEEDGCSFNQFDTWLREESNTTTPTEEYAQYCGGATTLPMSPDNFHACISAWTELFNDEYVLERNGIVQIVSVRFTQRVQFETPYSVLNEEWHLIEDWMEGERSTAPSGVNAMYHTSGDFWWYDTNGQMLQTAFAAAGIALGFSGLMVLISSRSVVLTIFSVFTIGYVLAATTATLVASGWTLGFLESINFAILIGISCDFVIHFGYAYSTAGKKLSRHDRTLYALIRMGPSILAAAFTTIGAAIVMLFTTITFFGQFAQILLYTVLHATIGSFVVYLTLTDCIGPSEPTYLMDKLWAMIRQRCGKSN